VAAEHPEPRPGTVKALYGRAFRCARPDCQRPLYKQDDDTGDLVLNSRVAHIHARRPGGPRWIDMTAEDNRGPGNLLLLCIEHSYEVDELPDRFPADLLRDWKQTQLDEYERVQRSWPIDDAQAWRVLEASSREAAQQQAGAVVAAVRAVERAALAARGARASPAGGAAEWRAARARARAAFTGWDEDGNTVHAEPSSFETEQRKAALIAELGAAAAKIVPLADDAKVELAAVRASRPAVRAWCDWVSRSLDEVVAASSAWPGPPALEDDGRLDEALRSLSEAADGLASSWRGEATAPPPGPPPVPDGRTDPLKEYRELLDQARPYNRVDHRPYDAKLRSRLAAAAEDAATLPPVLTTVSIDLTVACRLAAAVAKNADDAELGRLVEQDSSRRPLCAALLLLEELGRIAEERGRPGPAEQAERAFVALWDAIDWSDPDAWSGNENYGAAVFWTASRRTSLDAVRNRLSGALAARPEIVLPLIGACAGWAEVRDQWDGPVRTLRRTYASSLLGCRSRRSPLEAVAAAPHVIGMADNWDERDDPESLLGRVLRLARPS
jgi:hypothetical protein